ncbi:MAG: tRNA lysidine(34) synthetase TilS [Gammaproteobacteria bacterium]
MLTFTTNLLWQQLRQLTSSEKLLVAYSGGLDSHVLLSSLVKLREQYPTLQLQAVHVNHGLSPHAGQWARFTEQICQQWQVAYTLCTIAIDSTSGISLEAAARQARYKVLAELLKTDACLLTAHTQSDQAETHLLQLLRGAGPQGLAAMPTCRPFGKGLHARPLLSFTRSALQTYALNQELKWIEDESNYKLKFDRNYVRHCLMPIIEQRWPSAITTLARSAQHCAEASELLTELAQQDWQFLRGSIPDTLIISKLQQLGFTQQCNVLREWLKNLGFNLPSTIKLHQIIHEVLASRPDAQPQVTWNGVEIRRFRDLLFAIKPLVHTPSPTALTWDLQQPLLLPNDLGILTVLPSSPPLQQLKNADRLTLRFRQGGEVCHPFGRQGTHTLKKLFQEWDIPPWQRNRIPLLFNDEQLIAVIGYCVCAEYREKMGDYQIIWQNG